MSEIAYWFADNVLSIFAIILMCILILFVVGFLIYLAVIGFRNIIKSIRSKRKMMNDKLKPCPFCGFRAFIGNYEHRWYWVYCGLENCDVNPKTKEFSKKEYAIEAWNRRVNNETK